MRLLSEFKKSADWDKSAKTLRLSFFFVVERVAFFLCVMAVVGLCYANPLRLLCRRSPASFSSSRKGKKKKGLFIFLLFFRLTPDDEGIDEKKNIFSTVIAVVCLDFFCRGNQVASSSITIYQFWVIHYRLFFQSNNFFLCLPVKFYSYRLRFQGVKRISLLLRHSFKQKNIKKQTATIE